MVQKFFKHFALKIMRFIQFIDQQYQFFYYKNDKKTQKPIPKSPFQTLVHELRQRQQIQSRQSAPATPAPFAHLLHSSAMVQNTILAPLQPSTPHTPLMEASKVGFNIFPTPPDSGSFGASSNSAAAMMDQENLANQHRVRRVTADKMDATSL